MESCTRDIRSKTLLLKRSNFVGCKTAPNLDFTYIVPYLSQWIFRKPKNVLCVWNWGVWFCMWRRDGRSHQVLSCHIRTKEGVTKHSPKTWARLMGCKPMMKFLEGCAMLAVSWTISRGQMNPFSLWRSPPLCHLAYLTTLFQLHTLYTVEWQDDYEMQRKWSALF